MVDFIRRLEPDIQVDEALAAIDRGRATPGRRYWALDPIDGTKGFLRGGQYAVALAVSDLAGHPLDFSTGRRLWRNTGVWHPTAGCTTVR